MVSGFRLLCAPALVFLSNSVLAQTAEINLATLANPNHADVRAELQRAFKDHSDKCINGHDLTFRVKGVIEVRNDLCLRNVTLEQVMDPINTKPYTRSADRIDAAIAALNPGGKKGGYFTSSSEIFVDPPLTDAQHNLVKARTALRTLLVRGTDKGKVSLYLDNVRINKGNHESLGDAGSVAVYIDDAQNVNIRNLRIYGKGAGYGLLVHNSENVSMNGVVVEDITWAPNFGSDARDFQSLFQHYGFNEIPMYQYDDNKRRFKVVRSQELTSGIVISKSKGIQLRNSRVSNINVRGGGYLYPWQADGITIGDTTDVILDNVAVSNSWEGIDISGRSNDNIRINNLRIEDSMSYGVKLAHNNSNFTLTNTKVIRSGLTAIHIGGTAGEITRNIRFSNTLIHNVGQLMLTGGGVSIDPLNGGVNAAIVVRGINTSPVYDTESVFFDKGLIIHNETNEMTDVVYYDGSGIRNVCKDKETTTYTGNAKNFSNPFPCR